MGSPSSPYDPMYAYSLHRSCEKAAANEHMKEDFPTPGGPETKQMYYHFNKWYNFELIFLSESANQTCWH